MTAIGAKLASFLRDYTAQFMFDSMTNKIATFLIFFGFWTICAEGMTNTISYTDLKTKKVLGPLGHPLGEYITIEGKPCAVGFAGTFQYLSHEEIANFGIHSLEVSKVEGVKLERPIVIQFEKNPRYEPSDYYVVRGYQTGAFGPANVDPKYPTGNSPQTDYQFWISFVPTRNLSNEKNTEPSAPANSAPRAE